METQAQTPNRLIDERSPYLRQHAHNPVAWLPWGEEAFARAREEGKPIFLSIGYSACHWCHVMAHESFEDREIARLLNENFIPVKVDREERPDLDQVYQAAVQALAGQGGWPLSVFLAPDGEPFFGGTYFPPAPAYGRPGFPQILAALIEAWSVRPAELREIGRHIQEMLAGELAGPREPASPLSREALETAVKRLAGRIDRRHGGFGRAPKFPQTPALMFMLGYGRMHGADDPVALALLTLRRMARGGIYDQLGGGFHRYSTDDMWLVPHFEKMLYDNAQLLSAYTAAYQITRDGEFARVARGIVDYVAREMTAPEGGFYATQDADSEGVEGKFYVWTDDEIRSVLADDELHRAVRIHYGLAARGNFEGKNILYRAKDVAEVAGAVGLTAAAIQERLERAKLALFAAREKRVRPFRTEQIILGWNGLMLSGLARAAQALGDRQPAAMAVQAANFLLSAMPVSPTHLLRIYQDGQARIPAFLDDYAFLIRGLLDLYETDFDPAWLAAALRFLETVLAEFKAAGGRYTLDSARGERLFTRPVSGFDQAVPSGVAVHCQNLLRLHGLTGEERLGREAESILHAYAEEATRYPEGYAALLSALDMHLSGPIVVAIDGLNHPGEDLLRKLREVYLPYGVVAAKREGQNLANHPAAPVLLERPPLGGKTAFYICAQGSCQPPRTDWAGLAKGLAASFPDRKSGDGLLQPFGDPV